MVGMVGREGEGQAGRYSPTFRPSYTESLKNELISVFQSTSDLILTHVIIISITEL